MLIGHLSAALAAKSKDSTLPLWLLVLASQGLDVVWAILTLVGVETTRVEPALSGSTLVLEHAPFSHGLPAVLAWSLGAGLLLRLIVKAPVRSAVLLGVVVASHWVLDLVVHRPDLLVWGDVRAGAGLWDLPTAALLVEIAFVGVSGAVWLAARHGRGQNVVGPLVLVIGWVTAQLFFGAAPPPPHAAAAAATTLLIAATNVALAIAISRRDDRRVRLNPALRTL